MVCANPECGNELAPQPNASGRRRKWCCDQCRKDTMYVRHCLDCGAKLSGSDGNGPNAAVRCNPCASIASGREAFDHERRAEVARLWAGGATLREITDALGVAPEYGNPMMARYRAEGVDLPYRRPWWGKNRGDILAALRADAVRRGRPPTMSEWSRAAADHPAANTVRVQFGSWNAAITAAGLVPRAQNGKLAA